MEIQAMGLDPEEEGEVNSIGLYEEMTSSISLAVTLKGGPVICF